MGQKVGKLPKDRDALYYEKCRVQQWSAEIIARADENIDEENSFLVDYDKASINNKVNKWLKTELSRITLESAVEDGLDSTNLFEHDFDEVSFLRRIIIYKLICAK